MSQLLRGLQHIHQNGILHRDIKGANLLVNNKGELKITDFGLSREMNNEANKYTNRVVTRWYRAPELLLGSDCYDQSIDIWSVGLIFAELITNEPLFPGTSEYHMIDLIFQKLGYPTDAQSLELIKLFKTPIPIKKSYKNSLNEHFDDYSDK